MGAGRFDRTYQRVCVLDSNRLPKIYEPVPGGGHFCDGTGFCRPYRLVVRGRNARRCRRGRLPVYFRRHDYCGIEIRAPYGTIKEAGYYRKRERSHHVQTDRHRHRRHAHQR